MQCAASQQRIRVNAVRATQEGESYNSAKNSFHLCPGGSQKLREGPEPFPPQVAQLFAVDLLNRLIQPIHESEALRGDPSQYHAPVSAFAGAGNQAALFHAVEEPGHVGIAGNHAAGNLSAGEPLRCASKDAQDVVLSKREILALEDSERPACKHIGRAE